MAKRLKTSDELRKLLGREVTVENVGRWVDEMELCNERCFGDKHYLDRAVLYFASASLYARKEGLSRREAFSKYYHGKESEFWQTVSEAKEAIQQVLDKMIAIRDAYAMSPC